MPLALLIPHFNACGWSAPCRNLLRFLRQQEAEGVPVFVGELAYGEAEHFFPEAPNVLRLRTAERNTLWHKENLINLLEEMVPEEFDALAWIDGDVWFQRLDWLAATEAALEKYAVVQPFDEAVWTGERGIPVKIAPSAARAGGFGGHCGFAWAARRSLWRIGPGLFETGIIGGGDALMMTTWLDTADNMEWMRYPEAAAWRTAARAWMAREGGGCGAVEGTLWHEWHGDSARRAYGPRHERLRGLDISRHVQRNAETGVLEFAVDAPPDPLRKIRAYFHSRQEDGPAVWEADRLRATRALTPWMTEQELTVMAERLQPGDQMLEYGSGGSTLWLAARVAVLHTVEHDQAWAATMTAVAPDNVSVHWCRPETPHHGTTPAAPGQFAQYLAVPGRLGLQFDACLIDGRARVDAALRVAPFLRPGAWLFFHDWFGRTRYTGRLAELLGHYEWCEEAAVRESPQTLAVFRRRISPACEELSVPGTGAGPPCLQA